MKKRALSILSVESSASNNFDTDLFDLKLLLGINFFLSGTVVFFMIPGEKKTRSETTVSFSRFSTVAFKPSPKKIKRLSKID